jgi:hypothetical protein
LFSGVFVPAKARNRGVWDFFEAKNEKLDGWKRKKLYFCSPLDKKDNCNIKG